MRGRGCVLERAVAVEFDAAAEDVSLVVAARVAFGREIVARVEYVELDVEAVGDLLPVGQLLGRRVRNLVRAQLDAEARVRVVAPRLAPLGLPLSQYRRAVELDDEVNVGAAEQLDVDEREDRLLEGVARVVDTEATVGVRGASAERVVLQPVGIEGFNVRPGDGHARLLARRQPAADDPEAAAREHGAPLAHGHAVVEARALTRAPERLEGRDAELHGRRGPWPRLETARDVTAVDINLERLAAVLPA